MQLFIVHDKADGLYRSETVGDGWIGNPDYASRYSKEKAQNVIDTLPEWVDKSTFELLQVKNKGKDF